MKYLDLTVLFHDSMPSRIYLSILYQNGYCPKKIIYLKFRRGTKYNIAKNIIGERLLNKIIEKRKSKFIDINFANIFLEKFNLSYELLNKDIKAYSKEYVEVDVNNLQDQNLIDYLSNEETKTFLFTGGGILRKELLSIKDSKFIHIHPGIVPDVKGADGLFWSYLLRGKAGYSCFYMNEGIDTGDILQKDEYQLHKFKNIDLDKYKKEELYKYMLHYYDPCFRAQTLVNLIKKSEQSNQELNQLNYEVQNPEDGITYFFMHKKLRDFTLDKMVKEMID